MRVRLTQFCVMLLFLMIPLAFNGCADDQQETQEAVNAEQGEEGDEEESEYDDQEEGEEEYSDEEGEDEDEYADEEGDEEGEEVDNYDTEGGENVVDDEAGNAEDALANDDVVNNSLADTMQEEPAVVEDNLTNNTGGNMVADNMSQPNVVESPEGVDGGEMASGGDVQATPAALPEWGSKMPYIVVKGDTLGDIAGRIYGDRSKWREMSELSSLENPNLIYIADVVYYQLTQETAPFATAYESQPRQEVVVNEGDTLSTIASRVMNSSADWRHIWRQNDSVNDPDNLTAGTVLYYVAPGSLTVNVDHKVKSQVVEIEDVNVEVQDVQVTVDMGDEQPHNDIETAQINNTLAGDFGHISFI